MRTTMEKDLDETAVDYSRFYPSNFLKGVTKTMKSHSQDS
jgi:hypothetical protein